ncbi:MAG: ATP-binding cassette domain-containing protein [Desulfobacterales bacterium]|nr:ATP-binding cassette domain-containing protein [Desulfobacterales bacterium]
MISEQITESGNMSVPILNVNKLSKSYWDSEEKKDQPVLSDLDLQIHSGDRISILGVSGSGKSTLLNLLALLDSGQGHITYSLDNHIYKSMNGKLNKKPSGETADNLRSKFGFVFQTPFMLSNFSVHYNISLPLRLQNVSEELINDKVNEMLKNLDMSEHASKTADALSGGQRQRVAVGRALIHEPKIVFADEPTGNLDPGKAIEVMDLLQKVCEEVSDAALLLVTHDPCIAVNYTERIYKLDNGKLTYHNLGADYSTTCKELNQFLSASDKENSKGK